MATRKTVKSIAETSTGRNTQFKDVSSGHIMSRSSFVKAIENGKYNGYHVRKIHGIKTPVSNPDHSSNNNLD